MDFIKREKEENEENGGIGELGEIVETGENGEESEDEEGLSEPRSASLRNLRQFHVLDECCNERQSGSDSDGQSCDSDLPDDEIEAMLEDSLRAAKRPKLELETEDGTDILGEEEVKPYEEKDKIVLIEKGHNHFDVLPEGWIKVTHNSGMPLYLHKTSRVCTFSRPYFLGPGSARKHQVPLSAIPCLSYSRALDDEAKELKYLQEQKCIQEQIQSTSLLNPDLTGSSSALPLLPLIPNARIETVQENLEAHSLDPDRLRTYCEQLFKFKLLKVMRFKSWSARRSFTKRHKQERQLQRPTLPDGTKLITFPIQPVAEEGLNGAGPLGGAAGGGAIGAGQQAKKEWVMNPQGKSYVCILHEYVQHALKKQPSYKFKELENAATPYMAVVSINEMQYGVGYGTSKKLAKSEAAKATLEVLIPEMRAKISADAAKAGASGSGSGCGSNSTFSKLQDQDLSFFDEIRIEDPRVAEFCAKTTEPSPHAILLTCLQRNFGLGDMQISYQGNTLKHQRNEFTMTVGKHTATVVCKNKRDGKQRASQAILQALHPHIKSWGSLLRLYGSRSVKSFKERKLEEQEITLLQSKAAVNSPNLAILEKLRTEMAKLKDQRSAIRPIGTFVPPEDEEIPQLSSSNLNNVNL